MAFVRAIHEGDYPFDKVTKLVTLDEIMRRFKPELFLVLHGILTILSETPKKDKKVSHKAKETIKKILGAYKPHCIAMGFRVSGETIDLMLRYLDKTDCKYKRLASLATELIGRLASEMKLTVFLSLDTQETEYYDNSKKGWEKIIERFPAAVSDVEEAYKCFALSRYPAAIYHSLQIVEIGVVALGDFLKVADHKKGWRATRIRIEAIKEKKYKERDAFERKYFDFLEQVYGTMTVLENAWRDKISHASERPKLLVADISPELTEEILMASRGFLGRLATGLPIELPAIFRSSFPKPCP